MLDLPVLPPYNGYTGCYNSRVPRKEENMADNGFQAFPATEVEALAMLYLQNQDLSNVTPEGLLDMYYEACQRIKGHRRENSNQKHQIVSY